MKSLKTNENQNKSSNISIFMKCVTFTLAFVFILNMMVPSMVFADITSSVNNAGNSIYELVRNVSGAVGLGIMALGWFGNMIPIIEISQKAKMWIIGVGVGIVGISFSSQLIAWIQGIQ